MSAGSATRPGLLAQFPGAGVAQVLGEGAVLVRFASGGLEHAGEPGGAAEQDATGGARSWTTMPTPRQAFGFGRCLSAVLWLGAQSLSSRRSRCSV